MRQNANDFKAFTGVGHYVAEGVGMSSAAAPGFTGTATAGGDVNGCYSSWNAYWSASQSASNASLHQANVTRYPSTTLTSTEYYTNSELPDTTFTDVTSE